MSRKPEVVQTSHDGGAWSHVPCIDLLALPHIKMDQTESIHAHPRDSASKPLLFATRPADNVSKLFRATMWALRQSSCHSAFWNGCWQLPPPHKPELNPWEKAMSLYQIRRTFLIYKNFMGEHRTPSQTTYPFLGCNIITNTTYMAMWNRLMRGQKSVMHVRNQICPTNEPFHRLNPFLRW